MPCSYVASVYWYSRHGCTRGTVGNTRHHGGRAVAHCHHHQCDPPHSALRRTDRPAGPGRPTHARSQALRRLSIKTPGKRIVRLTERTEQRVRRDARNGIWWEWVTAVRCTRLLMNCYFRRILMNCYFRPASFRKTEIESNRMQGLLAHRGPHVEPCWDLSFTERGVVCSRDLGPACIRGLQVR